MDHGTHNDVTLVFEPQSGGSVPEREPETNTLRQFVAAVFQKLRITNAINPTVQRQGQTGVLSLDSTAQALQLHDGTKLNLAWQTGGGEGRR